jgi:hypothetical protein
MTKTIVIGTSYINDNKPIEFCYYLDFSLEQRPASILPSSFKFIELICKKYNGGGRDLMFAYNDPSNRSGTLYIGYWNSGTVK